MGIRTILTCAAAALAGAAPAAAQEAGGGGCGVERDPRAACEARAASFAAAGVVAVSGGTHGGVHVEGWDGGTVHVRAVVRAWAPEPARAREIAAAVTLATRDSVCAELPAVRGSERVEVELWVRVPRRSDVRLSSLHGDLAVAGMEGRVEMESVHGGLHVDGAAGEVRGRALHGPVHVALAGAGWRGAGVDVQTSTGNVTVEVPREYGARVQAATGTGRLRSDFPTDAARATGVRVGTDGPDVRVRTDNGDVRVRARGTGGVR